MQKPARHSKDARNDKIAVSRLTDWITSSGYAVPNIQSYDTWPNYDGIIDLIDDEGYVRGFLYAQVKKLPKKNKLKYTFKDGGKFLTYCRENASWSPILLIGVDLAKNCAYWLHMSEGFLSQLGTSETIHFDENQVISADNLESIRSWHTIAALYADIARERSKLEAEVNNLRQRIESSLIQASKPEFTKLHQFLDEYNRLLDHDLSIIKKVYYPNVWKLSIAYAEYEPNALSYFLYPIQSTVNDVAIKKLNPDIFKPHNPAPGGSTWHIDSNPIESNPFAYAKTLARERIDTILEHQLLDHSGSITLAREYIFAYVDKYLAQLGLSKKDRYTVAELEEAFTNYYPRWLFTTHKTLIARNNIAVLNSTADINGSILTLYNPDWIMYLDSATRQAIHLQVASQIASKSPPPMVVITGDKLSPALFARMLDFVKQKSFRSVVRLYKPKDFSLLAGAQSSYTWDVYSPVVRLYNTKRVTTRLQTVYNKIVADNFPQISRQLAFIASEHEMLYIYDNNENTGGPNPPQGARAYEIIASKANSRKRANFLLTSEHKIDTKFINSKWLLDIDGKEYEIVSQATAGGNFWMSDTPLLDMVYERLKKALSEYLKSAKPQYNNAV